MNNEFYMFLPSDSSAQMFPDNNPSHFNTHLAQEVTFDGMWEVGLKEIHYRKHWSNVGEDDAVIKFHDGSQEEDSVEWSQKSLVVGYYESPSRLGRAMNNILRTVGGEVSYNNVTKKFKIVMRPGCVAVLTHGLSRLMGFEPSMVYFDEGEHTAEFPSYIGRGTESLYVYTDIVRPVYVGDALAPLLQIVPVPSSASGIQHKEYVKPMYVSLCKTAFRTVEVDIRNSSGERIPFDSGKTTLLLHFRQLHSTA